MIESIEYLSQYVSISVNLEPYSVLRITQDVVTETMHYLVVYLPVECHLMGFVQFCRHLLAPQGGCQQCARVCPKGSALFSNVSVALVS